MKLNCSLFLFLLSGYLFSQNPNYKNPVVDSNFPDPTVIKAGDGSYYAYATNTAKEGKRINIQVLKSDDLVLWTDEGNAMPEPPEWSSSDFWAPHVTYDKKSGDYYLYYSGESNEEAIGKCLGIAVSSSPLGPFKDKGEPLLCGDTFINIDPMILQDDSTGKNYMYWGSGHESIKIRELSDDLLNFKEGSEMKELIHPVMNDEPENYEKLIEGVWLTKHDDFYYLFYSGDNCCGENAHYAVMVARSKSPEGPFEKYKNKKGNPVILGQNEQWLAPGHNSVITDEAGTDWIMYHAINSKHPEKGRMFLMDKLSYRNGWPVIEEGSPSTKELPAPKTIIK